MATGAKDPTTMTARGSIQVLARLPNELLSTICSWLPIPDVRVLGHVNRWLQDFVTDYLRVYQYKSGLFHLPDPIILTIAHGLSQQDHSRLARTSQKLYPKLMRPVILRDITPRSWGKPSESLFSAARNDDVEFARKVVLLGGDVNLSRGFYRYRHQPWNTTPLATAIWWKAEHMIRWLLEEGARMSSHREYDYFWSALEFCHDTAVCILLENPAWSGQFYAAEKLFLGAVQEKMVKFVQTFLEARSGEDLTEYVLHNRSCSWACLLQLHNWGNGKVNDDVYKISALLLEHGCDPDAQFWTGTPRYWASQYLDPRIRNLFADRMPDTSKINCIDRQQIDSGSSAPTRRS